MSEALTSNIKITEPAQEYLADLLAKQEEEGLVCVFLWNMQARPVLNVA